VFDPQRRPTPRARGALVPDAVEAVLARALSVDPRGRPADAGELWAELVAASMPAPPTYGTPPPSSLQGVVHYGPSSQPYPGPPYAPQPAPGPGGHRTANVIAIVVGVGLGLLVLLALATWIVTRR
jgi:serine/threonine-protein kinase